ncbi:molybdate transport system regulatory protein [Azotobacter beijerinckii]|uniref:Molybdate transport system regulatory protein n=1 Tax=Azotobacter beijerinckii TaxID=170623 RepID=A0A1I4B0L1_9GAMM|nr:TOBE domain-containing protein [Azotobacter beijerinckii]SEI40137.1 molybdate transport system regulatory protein [Azotobacter beijerinckii]SEI44720.1 molybdate transport system regulatory protein [Azotobacter beijerinckii]SEQ61194.1 molybdate transport system regulatory protein [Azotobacter beijerinckii]SFB03533.1 molybdate transport system regulatory protein [Azotobacter beijerinckii]SFK61930.1 molybdate transport system regulatory protein [Azotobacter beijerinckii]
MKISARNVFSGTVSALKEGAVNAEVDIALSGGDKLAAVVTMESAKSLGLAAGKPVVAVIKAPWVLLMTDGSGYRLSARNILTGTVKTIEAGAVNAEVTLTLAGGTEITSVVTKEAVAELGLKPGGSASAVIKASNVILGVPA